MNDGILPNAALLLWIPVAIGLFFSMRAEKAALITIFGGLMFLPEVISFRIPFLPPLGKQTIPYFGVLIGYTLRSPRRVWRLPRERWVLVVVLAMIVDGIGLAMTNADSLTYGFWRKIELPGLGIKDGMFVALSYIFRMGVPFFVGTAVVREVGDLEELLRFLVKAGLVYCPFALLEIRLSPQLHRWIYGYYQHDFIQAIRFGGYRPTVFMAHGLTVAIFFAVCVLSSATLTRLPPRRIWGMSARTTTLILAVMLLLCKSTGAIVYVAAIGPLIYFGSYKMQRRVAVLLSVVVLLYPSMRESDVFPTAGVLSMAQIAGQDRADSMAYRFTNEDMLLKKARQRPWFGWGEYGRNEVYNDNAKIATVTDGQWIIALGISGFVGFLSTFGLLLIPLFLVGRRLRKTTDRGERTLISATSLILAVTAVDLLPNSLASNYPYFISGALLSASAALSRVRPQQQATFEAELDFAEPDPAPGATSSGWGGSEPSGSAV
jgi:hypothetical protein